MREVARAVITPAEVEEELEYLIDQYQKHMRLHRMKTNVGALEGSVAKIDLKQGVVKHLIARRRLRTGSRRTSHAPPSLIRPTF
jgi:hypothetical protein